MRKKIFFLVILIALSIVLMPSAFALDISSFDADYTVLGSSVEVIYKIGFITNHPDNFSIELPSHADIGLILVDDIAADIIEKKIDTKNTITFPVNSSGNIIVFFNTADFIDSGNKNYFVADIKSNYDIATVHAKVSLPPNSFLTESKQRGGSVFPQGNIDTDGRIIYVEWIEHDISSENSFPMLVVYHTVKGLNFLVYVLTLAVLGLLAYFGFPYFVRRHIKKIDGLKKTGKINESKKSKKSKMNISSESEKSEKSNESSKKINVWQKDHNSENADFIISTKSPQEVKEESKESKEKEKKRDMEKLLTHLTEDEQQVVNILLEREGRIEQGTLVIITGFSKAHLSRLLDELQRRKIIHKEKKGKKNLVWLKSHF